MTDAYQLVQTRSDHWPFLYPESGGGDLILCCDLMAFVQLLNSTFILPNEGTDLDMHSFH